MGDHINPAHVLIAEDDPAMRALLESVLASEGLDVDAVADGAALCERLSKEAPARRPDIVVSDVRMPRMSGLAVLNWLRTTHTDLRVILITAFGDAKTHARAAQLGASVVLDKPFDVAELAALIKTMVATENPTG